MHYSLESQYMFLASIPLATVKFQYHHESEKNLQAQDFPSNTDGKKLKGFGPHLL